MTIKKILYRNICIFIDADCRKEYKHTINLINHEVDIDRENGEWFNLSEEDSSVEEYKSVMKC